MHFKEIVKNIKGAGIICLLLLIEATYDTTVMKKQYPFWLVLLVYSFYMLISLGSVKMKGLELFSLFTLLSFYFLPRVA